MNDVMLDLETWGTAPGSAIRSIGAVLFDPRTDQIGDTFYANISDSSCHNVGLTKDGGTVDWWFRQSKQAQDSLNVNPRPIHEVAQEFRRWFGRNAGYYVWAQGSNFDPVLWEAACKAVVQPVPWKFFNCSDTRTIYRAAGFDPRTLKRDGTYHNALDDAKHQVKCVQASFKKISGVLI